MPLSQPSRVCKQILILQNQFVSFIFSFCLFLCEFLSFISFSAETSQRGKKKINLAKSEFIGRVISCACFNNNEYLRIITHSQYQQLWPQINPKSNCWRFLAQWRPFTYQLFFLLLCYHGSSKHQLSPCKN